MKTSLIALTAISLLSTCQNKESSDGDTSVLKDCPVVARQVITADGDTVTVCQPALLKDTIEFPLSALLSDFKVIKLEDKEKALVKESGALAVSDHYVGIYSGTGYKLFDREGKYITDLSSRGQGPNEYTISIYDSQIDEKNDRAYLLPMSGDRLLVYDLQGNAGQPIPLAYGTSKGKFRIDAENKRIYVANMTFEADKKAFWVQDFEGNVLQEITAAHLAITPPDFSNELDVSMNQPAMDYSLFHWMPQNDTLYHYREQDNRLVPAFTVDFGEKPVMHDYIELPEHYLLRLIEVQPTYRYTYVLIDKHTLKGSYMRLKMDMLGNINAPSWLQFDRGFFNTNLYAHILQEQWSKLDEVAIAALPSGVSQLAKELQEADCENLNNFVLIGKLKRQADEEFEMMDATYTIQPVTKESGKEQSEERKAQSDEKANDDDPDKIYTGFVFSHVPMLKGGNDYFRNNNRYKDWDSNDPKQVMVGYVVEKDGTASNIVVLESSGNDDLDKEAVRLIKETEYTVGVLRKNGKKVRAESMANVVHFPPK